MKLQIAPESENAFFRRGSKPWRSAPTRSARGIIALPSATIAARCSHGSWLRSGPGPFVIYRVVRIRTIRNAGTMELGCIGPTNNGIRPRLAERNNRWMHARIIAIAFPSIVHEGEVCIYVYNSIGWEFTFRSYKSFLRAHSRSALILYYSVIILQIDCIDPWETISWLMTFHEN